MKKRRELNSEDLEKVVGGVDFKDPLLFQDVGGQQGKDYWAAENKGDPKKPHVDFDPNKANGNVNYDSRGGLTIGGNTTPPDGYNTDQNGAWVK